MDRSEFLKTCTERETAFWLREIAVALNIQAESALRIEKIQGEMNETNKEYFNLYEGQCNAPNVEKQPEREYETHLEEMMCECGHPKSCHQAGCLAYSVIDGENNFSFCSKNYILNSEAYVPFSIGKTNDPA